jgi:XTP/dITP diphosphohydrolase
MEIIVATRNQKKLEEIRRILEGPALTIRTLEEFPDCPEVVEDGRTFEENAVKKSVSGARHTERLALADDSGLEVDALAGAPGVLSARYAGEPADDRANLARLLEAMRDVKDDARQARFVCCIALASPDGTVRTFWGVVEGTIGREPRGSRGFGYDPIFYPRGARRTFSEMDDDDKDQQSHRGIALRALKRYLSGLPGAAPVESGHADA